MSKVPKVCKDPGCKDHIFCIREEPTLIHDPKTIEFNPINPFVKAIPTDYDEHLSQPFYYRDIMLKKKAQAEMGPEEFKNRFGVYPESHFKAVKENYLLYDHKGGPPNLKDFFVDDGQTRYESDPYSSMITQWQKDSYKFATKIKEDGNKAAKETKQ